MLTIYKSKTYIFKKIKQLKMALSFTSMSDKKNNRKLSFLFLAIISGIAFK